MPSPFTGPLWPTDPLMMLMMTGGMTNDPQLQDQVAHYLATQYQPPAIPAHADPSQQTSGASITPPPPGQTVAQLTPQMRTPGDTGAGLASAPLPTGDPTAKAPSTAGVQGSDGQSIQPGPQAPSLAPTLRPETPQPSPKDQTAHAGVDTSGTSQVGATDGVGPLPPGMSQSDVTDVSPDTQVAPFTAADTTAGQDLTKAGTAFSDLGKALGALQPPQSQDIRMANAPLPAHESRFTPQDLLAMIQQLGQAGSKTQPQSLGALIGR